LKLHRVNLWIGQALKLQFDNLKDSTCQIDETLKVAIWPLDGCQDFNLTEIGNIPAKKWGDTEIAERGRSVLVMRACYRSAGLTLHQRGWTDAG